MEQGWGLPNVTRASEIITSGAGDLTIMTPRKYPTLPGTSSVQIVGEDRPDQNITIISTHTLGTVDIILEGNATQFVRVGQNTISVGTGYNHFSIGLDVQSDLPLSSIGRYTGELVLASGGQKIAVPTLNTEAIVSSCENCPTSPKSAIFHDPFTRSIFCGFTSLCV